MDFKNSALSSSVMSASMSGSMMDSFHGDLRDSTAPQTPFKMASSVERVNAILREEADFSERIGGVFDRLVEILEDKRDGARIIIAEKNPLVAPPTPKFPRREIEINIDAESKDVLEGEASKSLWNKIQTHAKRWFKPISDFFAKEDVRVTLQLIQGIAMDCLNKIKETFRDFVKLCKETFFEESSSLEEGSKKEEAPPHFIIQKIDEIWSKTQAVFKDIKVKIQSISDDWFGSKLVENHPPEKEVPLSKRVEGIWKSIALFFNEIQDGVEETIGSKQEPIKMEQDLFANGATSTLNGKYVEQVIRIAKESGVENPLRRASAEAFNGETVAKIQNSIGAIFESKVLSFMPGLGIFQSEEKKTQNLKTYYALEALFGGPELFHAICQKAQINRHSKEFNALPWTKEDIASLVRAAARVSKDELKERFKKIEVRHGCGPILPTLRTKSERLIQENSLIFFDVWKMAHYGMKPETHFMNNPPDILGYDKSLDHSDYLSMSLMQQYYTNEMMNPTSPENREKVADDFLVSFAQEMLGHPIVKNTILFTPWGLLKNDDQFLMGGASAYYYKPLTQGMNYLVAFPGMRIENSASVDDWYSRANAFRDKIGAKNYEWIKPQLSIWLSDIASRIKRNGNDPRQAKCASITLLAKSLGTEYAMRCMVDHIAEFPIQKVILIAGPGIEEEAHHRLRENLLKRKTEFVFGRLAELSERIRAMGLKVIEYRHIKDLVPTVGGPHLGATGDDLEEMPDNFSLTLHLFTDFGEISHEEIPECFLTDTPPNHPDYEGFTGKLKRYWNNLSDIKAVLHHIAEFKHIGQMHKWKSTTDHTPPVSITYSWPAPDGTSDVDTYRKELNGYLSPPTEWEKRRGNIAWGLGGVDQQVQQEQE